VGQEPVRAGKKSKDKRKKALANARAFCHRDGGLCVGMYKKFNVMLAKAVDQQLDRIQIQGEKGILQ
jgi:hypothetical protein